MVTFRNAAFWFTAFAVVMAWCFTIWAFYDFDGTAQACTFFCALVLNVVAAVAYGGAADKE